MQHALRPCEMTQCILMRNQRREQADSLVFDSRFPHFLKQFLKPNPVAKGLPNAQQFRSRVLLLFLTASQVFKAVSYACIPSCDCIHLLSRRGRSIPLFPMGLSLLILDYANNAIARPIPSIRSSNVPTAAGKSFPNCQASKCPVTSARKKRAK